MLNLNTSIPLCHPLGHSIMACHSTLSEDVTPHITPLLKELVRSSTGGQPALQHLSFSFLLFFFGILSLLFLLLSPGCFLSLLRVFPVLFGSSQMTSMVNSMFKLFFRVALHLSGLVNGVYVCPRRFKVLTPFTGI